MEAPKATVVIMLLVKYQVTTSPSVSLILSKLIVSYVTCEHSHRIGEGSSGPVEETMNVGLSPCTSEQ